METKFHSSDGMVFSSEVECEAYELQLQWVRKGFLRFKGEIVTLKRSLANIQVISS